MMPLKAVGITCGIGSMLVGARQAGFDIVGNVEWRKYYHEKDDRGRNTFRENFPGSRFIERMTDEEFEKFSNPDLALGHPECGNFSQLSGANADKDARLLDPADIPLFVDLVARLRPKYFVMDDLPKSFMAFPMAEYAARLPDYDLYPEWISNWGYGNIQKSRNRMFMLGSLKSERWAFRPGEFSHASTVHQALEDLPAPMVGSNYPNHEPHELDADAPRAGNMRGYGTRSTWRQVKEHFKDLPVGNMKYPTKDGRIVERIGFVKGHWDGPAHVLTGGNATLHNRRCEPYSIRERARIQGFPDDFVFYGTKLNSKGEWDHAKNQHIVRQTGKAMPVQFCRYVASQMAARIKREPWICTDTRVINPNKYIDEAKVWYCSKVGYENQKAACSACWLRKRCPITVVPADARGEGIARLVPR
jgi:DNA (cytosine-5)-methyltransferase 1